LRYLYLLRLFAQNKIPTSQETSTTMKRNDTFSSRSTRLGSCLLLAFLLFSCDPLEDIVINLGELCNQPFIEVTTTAEGNDQEDTCPPGDEGCTLRAALNTAAICGGTVTIQLGENAVYTLSDEYVASTAVQNRETPQAQRVGNVALPRIYSTVIIEGVEGQEATIRLGSLRARFFHILGGGHLTLRHVILEGGRGPQDAGRGSFERGLGSTIYNEGTLVAENVTIKDSKDRHAVYNNAPEASASFKNCQFDSNYGAILVEDGQVSVDDSTRFFDNTLVDLSGYHGSVVYMRGGELNIKASTFERNGLPLRRSEPIAIWGGQVTIDQSTFKGNAGNNVGSINLIAGELSITRSTFYGENSDTFGAIFCNERAILSLTDVTIHGCTASSEFGAGGLTVARGGNVEISNTVISNNQPRNGGFVNPPTLLSTCLSTDESCPGFTVIGDPNFVGDAPAYHGGPTQTLLPGATSPVIDAGTFDMSRQDQRGQMRPVGGATDVGAVERHPTDL
jgi:hypothetical protein